MTTALVPAGPGGLLPAEPQRPSYRSAALLHPAPITAVALLSVVALITGSWIVGIGVAAAAALWVFLSPALPFFRRHVDRKQERTRLRQLERDRLRMVGQLSQPDQQRFFRLRDRLQQAYRAAAQAPQNTPWLDAHTKNLFEDALGDFLRLGVVVQQCQQRLQQNAVASIETEAQQLEQQIHAAQGDAARIALLQQTRAVLAQRTAAVAAVSKQQQDTRDQMRLLENTFLLLLDQVSNPQLPALALAQLTGLRDHVDVLVQTQAEATALEIGLTRSPR